MARIVFDLDGTLVDSAGEIHAAVARMLEDEGIRPLDQATITSFVGNGLPHLVKLVIGATGLDMARHEALTARVLAHFNAIGGEMSALYPGVLEALNTLREGGHRMGVCTNKPLEPALHILKKLGLDHFEVVLGGDSLPERKPDPAPLHRVLADLGEGRAIYVGDSEVDGETAARASVPFLLYSEGYRKGPISEIVHHAVFDDFGALPGLIDRFLLQAQ